MSCANLSNSKVTLDILAKLKDSSLRITEQRKALIDFLVASQKALTIQQVYVGLVDIGIKVDEASIYRSIKVLKELKIVHELDGGAISLCQHSTCGDHHMHMSWLCDSCGLAKEPKMEDIKLNDLQKILGFKPNHISHVRVNYLCKECR